MLNDLSVRLCERVLRWALDGRAELATLLRFIRSHCLCDALTAPEYSGRRAAPPSRLTFFSQWKHGGVLLFVICLAAKTALGADSVSEFAKQSLDLDLGSIRWNSAVKSNEYTIVSPPMSLPPLGYSVGVVWATNAASVKYSKEHPDRDLKFGLSNGQIAAVRVSISAFKGGAMTGGKINQRRHELVQIQSELNQFKQAQKVNPGEGSFKVQSGAMCSSGPDSIVMLEIEITPSGKPKTP